MEITRSKNADKLEPIDQTIYDNEISKCIACKGYEHCTLNTKGIMPIVHEYKFRDHDAKYKIHNTNCPKKIEYFRKQAINLTGKYREQIMKSDKTILDDKQKQLVNELYKNGQGFLFGKAGVGKTTIMQILAKELYLKEKNVHFELAANITISLRDYDGLEAKMNKYQDADILFIDDFAREYLTQWNILNVWSPIIQHREGNGKPTFISCNYSTKELGMKLVDLFTNGKKVDTVPAETIVDRINKLGVYELKGKNYRLDV